MTPTRAARVADRDVFVFDGLVPVEESARYYAAISQASFKRTESARPDSLEYRHWVCEMPLENLPRTSLWTATAQAVLRARESSMSFRNDALLSLVQDELNVSEPCFFTTAIFELGETAPLSWALTDHDVARLEHAAGSPALRARVDAVREWLTAGPEAQKRARERGLCPGGREL